MYIHQITQISESHCGAAVLQMLLETMGVTTDQKTIAEAARVENTIEEHGMRIDQIAIACNRIAPHLAFWYKYYSSLEDLRYLLKKDIAVGVEWQGLFYQSVEEEEKEGKDEADYGHYSAISFYDEELQQLVIVDPYKDFANQNRVFSLETFLERWWDTNEIKNEHTGKKEIVEDNRLLFFLTSSEEKVPTEMGFKQFNIVRDY
jgi:hypothetical protein